MPENSKQEITEAEVFAVARYWFEQMTGGDKIATSGYRESWERHALQSLEAARDARDSAEGTQDNA